MIIENILIDLDGTLTDPKLGITTCIRYAMQKLGRLLADEVDLDWCIGAAEILFGKIITIG